MQLDFRSLDLCLLGCTPSGVILFPAMDTDFIHREDLSLPPNKLTVIVKYSRDTLLV